MQFQSQWLVRRCGIHVPSAVAGAIVTALALAALSSLGGSDSTYAAERTQYKVEQGLQRRDPQVFEELLNQRAQEGWLFQGLDHETVIFRRSTVVAKPTPTPEP